ncbi:MAG: HPF/RaiA family ribosome-associated protein [Planctomycetales bacterium]|nr:HPF/RaiA family ribosome-associated protein [Planctomycetales bacterium]
MKVLVKTDGHIKGSAKFTHHVETVVQNALHRFGDRITRVEVYFSDQNSGEKFGDDDKRCVMEARPAGLQPITVSHQGASVEQALDGATDTLQKTLKRSFERRDDPQGRKSYAGDQET